MKRNILIIIFAAVLLPVWSAYAQSDVTEQAVADEQATEMTVIAEVDIHDAHLIEQKGHNLAIDFTFDNGNGAQSDIRYAVRLVKNDPKLGQSIVFQKIYDEAVTLAENSFLYKEISCDIPAYLSGTYDVWIIAQNGSGLPLASGILGAITLYGDNSPYITIDDATCQFFIKDLPENYTLDQGVDVAQNEVLVLSCETKNTFNEKMTVQPFVQTYMRSLFGEKVDAKAVSQMIEIAPREKKEITVEIPKQQKPQAYSIAVTLQNSEKKDISSTVYAHYVVRGNNASISNLQLDKSVYTAGEMITAKFIATPSADRFFGARGEGSKDGSLYYNMTITDSNNKECIKPIARTDLSQEGITTTVTQKSLIACKEPMVMLSLEDEQGTILAKKTYNFVPTKTGEESQSIAQEGDKDRFGLVAWIVIGVITAFALLVIIGYKYKERSTKILVFLLLSGGLFFGVLDARALTLEAHIAQDWGSYAACDFNLSRSTVSRGERFWGTSSGCHVVYCGNKAKMKAHINSAEVASWELTRNKTKWYYDESISSSNVLITAGNECGRYFVPVDVQFWHYYDNIRTWRTTLTRGSLPYRVVNCDTVDGELGVSTSGCADGVTRSGQVNLSVTNITGVGSGTVQYRYKCGTQAWTGWTTTSTYTCSFLDAGAKTVYAEINRGSATVQKSALVTIVQCPIDGACNSDATGTYTISETAFRGSLCSSGTPTVTPAFPTYGQTVTWGCSGLNGGTSTSPTACTATRERPTPSCGTANGVTADSMPPLSGYTLCGTDSTPSTVTFDTAGNWHWTCTHTSPAAIPQSVDCQAPSCLATMPVDLQPYVYFGSDGTPNDATATVTCPNVCCIINSGNGAVTVCNGDATPGMIPVFPGSHSYPAECWFDDDHDRTNDGIDEPKVSYNPGRTISTMCTARSCNSQGTCQSTPEVTNSADSCTSTCNSDA
ncbi:MAG: hypothetical protein WC819_06535, partial [Parcubacteria group bacterium]